MSEGIDLSHLAVGVEVTPVQMWRDPQTRNVIIQVEEGHTQAVFTPVQWERAKEFLDNPVITNPDGDLAEKL